MRQLFVLDPLGQINPAKDSSTALMQAAHRAGDEGWSCTPSDLIARGDEPLAIALPVTPEPWITVGVRARLARARALGRRGLLLLAPELQRSLVCVIAPRCAAIVARRPSSNSTGCCRAQVDHTHVCSRGLCFGTPGLI